MSRSLLCGILVLFLLFSEFGSARGQARVDGQVYSMLYGLENASSNQQWDYFQGFNVRVRPSNSRLTLKTNFRIARRGDPGDWTERVYSAYANYRSSSGKLVSRLGRQFLYRGVLSGSFDGLSMAFRPRPEWSVQVIGGTRVAWNRSLAVQSYDDAGLIGFYSEYRPSSGGPRLDVSFINRRSGRQNAWQQAGAGIAGTWLSNVFYQAQLEYNLKASTIQRMRYRLTYRPDKWAISAEYNSQKPRVFEDSFFNFFELVAADQFRIGASWRSKTAQLGVRYVHTSFKETSTTDEVFISADTRYGTAGFVYKTGFGGDNTGVFGDLKYPLTRSFEVNIRSSYYSYERRSLSFNEDATSFSGGFKYRPVSNVLFDARVQQTANSYFTSDTRLLLRLSYALR